MKIITKDTHSRVQFIYRNIKYITNDINDMQNNKWTYTEQHKTIFNTQLPAL